MVQGSTFDFRTSGVLLHVTSLPGPHGSGDLGPEAFRFVDQLAAAGQTWWQMLPVQPPGPTPECSPYSASSIHAGAAHLISLEALVEDGLLTRRDFRAAPAFDPRRVNYQKTIAFRVQCLRTAHARFLGMPNRERTDYLQFCAANAAWVEDEALFSAFKHHFTGGDWCEWPAEIRDRRPEALAEFQDRLADEIDYHRFVQYLFDRQWNALRQHANASGVKLIGDVPIFVSHDAVPVWCRPELWHLDARKRPKTVSGYPPDFFSKDGQNWGHPQYAWKRHEEENYAWWVGRFASMFKRFDAVRIDHFLGFERLWVIPAGKSAREGKWVNAPGDGILTALHEPFVSLPIIAEDLGRLTPAAAALRDRFNLPGMRIFQFGFGGEADDYHLPHSYPPRSVAYTGTHDNETVAGFLASAKKTDQQRVIRYAGGKSHWDMIRTVMASAAHTTIFPLQDLLGLNNKFRMNVPSTTSGNWSWRYRREDLTPAVLRDLGDMTTLFRRSAKRDEPQTGKKRKK